MRPHGRGHRTDAQEDLMTYRGGDAFAVLAVCTGNVCRSPAVERLLRRALGAKSGVQVASAGTGALVGEPIQPPMAALLEGLDVETEQFAARRLTPDLVRESDLVLTLTRAHRGDVVDLFPGAVRRTFTLRELARLTEHVPREELDAAAGPDATPAERLSALIPLAAARRAPVPEEHDDVVDPYRRDASVYQRSFDQMLPAVRTIARAALRL
ncbi:low molecular weight phosphatase family protein [Georgenia faecalis]|uniref:Low molecular weight phosphatase family protein n=2 Tax=Georgenia faecalis TaxID=2483799 RepID=A0ABV9D5Z8_9MICO|nr:low molecular weight phosphatase family protein [Georgenia faecalis]